MVTREILKREIDSVQDEYLAPLYKIIKTFEHSDELDELDLEKGQKDRQREDWHQFIDKFAGCLADTPIERGDQGDFEVREKLV